MALAQAAAYIDVHKITIRRYIELYRQERDRLLAAGPRPIGYPDTVATTWLLHFSSFERDHPAAIGILRMCAFLDADHIPVDLILSSDPQGVLPQDLSGIAGKDLDLIESVGALLASSLLAKVDEHAVRVHRLVQQVTRANIAAEERGVWCQRLAMHLMTLKTQMADLGFGAREEESAWKHHWGYSISADLETHIARIQSWLDHYQVPPPITSSYDHVHHAQLADALRASWRRRKPASTTARRPSATSTRCWTSRSRSTGRITPRPRRPRSASASSMYLLLGDLTTALHLLSRGERLLAPFERVHAYAGALGRARQLLSGLVET